MWLFTSAGGYIWTSCGTQRDVLEKFWLCQRKASPSCLWAFKLAKHFKQRWHCFPSPSVELVIANYNHHKWVELINILETLWGWSLHWWYLEKLHFLILQMFAEKIRLWVICWTGKQRCLNNSPFSECGGVLEKLHSVTSSNASENL